MLAVANYIITDITRQQSRNRLSQCDLWRGHLEIRISTHLLPAFAQLAGLRLVHEK